MTNTLTRLIPQRTVVKYTLYTTTFNTNKFYVMPTIGAYMFGADFRKTLITFLYIIVTSFDKSGAVSLLLGTKSIFKYN